MTGQTRGLPAFQKIAEEIGPYVTPYPRNWKNPSDSVAKEFYRWAPAEGAEPDPGSAEPNRTVIVARIKPGAEPEVARIFGESDAGSLPNQLGVTGRWLYSIDDVYLHVLERTDAAFAAAIGTAPRPTGVRQDHGGPEPVHQPVPPGDLAGSGGRGGQGVLPLAGRGLTANRRPRPAGPRPAAGAPGKRPGPALRTRSAHRGQSAGRRCLLKGCSMRWWWVPGSSD